MEAADRRGDTPEIVRFAGLTLDAGGRSLRDARGQEIALRRAEFDLLLAFARHPGRALSRDALLDAVVGRRAEPFDRSIDVHVVRLRQKIEAEPRKPRLIITVPGIGYKFTAKPVPATADEPPAPTAPSARAVRPAERRQVTVLRCSLDGYAALAARLDPEDLGSIITAYHAGCAQIVARHGGLLVQPLGEDVLAYFGYPEASEHAAERAVYAGLAMVPEVGKTTEPAGTPIAARVAIATSPVLVGKTATLSDAPDVLGEAPALAAQLLTLAAPGGVIIAETTRRLVGDLFELAPHACGAAFAVLGERAEANRFAALRGSALTPLIGRAEELALLAHRWRQAQAGTGRIVSICGEPGIGKSRLVHEFRAELAGEPLMQISCFCSPHHQDSAYHPIVGHLEHAAGFARADRFETRLKKLNALLAPARFNGEASALMAELMSVPTDGRYPPLALSPQQRRNRTVAALVELLVATARKQPVLLTFEDVHWIDPTSREVLEAVIERIADLPVLLLVTYRPEFAVPWTSLPLATTLFLTRLGTEQTAAMVTAAGGAELSEEQRRQIAERADGVPLYVEELTRATLEGGAVSVPASLRDSLMERLDRAAAAKRAAQLGAVIGRSFSHELVTAVADSSPEELACGLDALVSSGLASRRGVTPGATYTFKHVLVQDAAYQSLIKADRASIHGRIVDTLIAKEPEIEQSRPDLLAHHCEQAGLTERAVEYYAYSAGRSVRHGALSEAGSQFDTSLRLIATLPPGEKRHRAELTSLHGLNCVQMIKWGYAHSARRPVLDRMVELFVRLGEPKEFLSSVHWMWNFLMSRGEFTSAIRATEHLLRWSERHGDPCGLLMGLVERGWTHALQGELLDARADIEQMLKLRGTEWRESAEIRLFESRYFAGPVWASPHLFLASILTWLGHVDQAIAQAEIGLEQSKTFESLVKDAEFLAMAVRSLMFFLPPADLLSRIEKLQELSRGQAASQLGAVATIFKGNAIVRSGDLAQGRAVLARGLAAYEATEAVPWTCFFQALLAEAHQMPGEAGEALRVLTDALRRTSQTGERWYVAELHRRIGEVHFKCGRNGAARQSFDRALAIARAQHTKLWELQAATSYARLLRDEGKPDEAHALLFPVHAWFTEGFDTVPLRDAQALLGELEHERS